MIRTHSILTLVAALLLATVPASSQGLLYPAIRGSVREGARPLMLLYQDLDVRVRDGHALTVLTQTFRNQGSEALEGLYLMPIPQGAHLTGFAVLRGGRRLEAEVRECDAAREEFAAGRDAGEEVALLELAAERVFRGRIANLPSGGLLQVQVRLEEDLPVQAGVRRYRFPAWTATDGIPSAALLTVSLRLEGSTHIAQVASPTHPELSLRTTEDGWKLARMQAWDAALDRDLVLYYRTEHEDLGLAFTGHRDPADEWGVFALDLFFDRTPAGFQPRPRDVVLLADVSASSRGPRLRSLRSALLEGLASLRGTDRFVLIPFAEEARVPPEGLEPVSAESLGRAERRIQQLAGRGGTDLVGAVLAAVPFLADPGRDPLLVLLTDGVPTLGTLESSALLETLEELLPDGVRVACFGLASHHDQGILETLARQRHGAFRMAYEPENARAAASLLFHRLAQPTLRDLTVEIRGEGVETIDLEPEEPLDLAMGFQETLLGRYRGSGPAEILLHASLDGVEDTYRFPVEFPDEALEHGFVARLWARRRVDGLLGEIERGGPEEDLRHRIVKLGTRYRIATPYTSFVVPREASLRPGRILPGDPEILVPAPPDARSVTVDIPFVGRKECRYDPVRGVWVVRFLIPRSVPDGVYRVEVRIRHLDGLEEVLWLGFTVDTAAPPLTLDLTPAAARAGELVRVAARPKVHVLDLFDVMIHSPPKDWIERARALGDVRTARLYLPGGDSHELERTVREDVWRTVFAVPDDAEPGPLPLVVVATDPAGNMTYEPLVLEVLP